MLTLDFTPLDIQAARALLRRARRVPLLQTYDYARAIAGAEGITPRWALLRDDGVEVGFTQFFQASLVRGLLQAVVLDRGPVWFDGAGTAQQHSEFWRAFDCLFPRRLGRRRRLIPELPLTAENEEMMVHAGLRPMTRVKPYQTFWLDLTRSAEDIRAGLDGKWRNRLTRAEKDNPAVVVDDKGALLPWLLLQAEQDRKARGYKAASPRLLAALTRCCLAGEGALIVQVGQQDARPVAGGLFLLGGGSATYQVGWVSPHGRQSGAGNMMLWQAILALQARGVRDLDLGGGNDEDAAGVTHFKAGVNGDHVTLVGQFC